MSRQAGKTYFFVVLLIGLIITLSAAWQARMRIIHKEQTHSTKQVNDFDRWMTMVPEFLHKHIAYTSDSFPTPPVTLIIFAPFTWLSPANAQFAWVCCKLIFCCIIFFALFKAVKKAGVELDMVALTLILLVWLPPVMGDMQEGQTNLLMLTPLATGLALGMIDKSWARWIGGIFVGMAVCIKVTPIIFLIYFAWKRQWKIVGGIGMGLVLGLLVIPTLFFGWSQNWAWFREWFNIMIVPYVTHGRVEYYVGQSVPSFLSRLLRHVPAFYSHPHGIAKPHYVNLFNLHRNISDDLIRVILIIIGLIGLWWARSKLKPLGQKRYLLEIGAVAAFMLWASPRTWVPHYVSLAMTLFAMGMILCDKLQPLKNRQIAFFVLVGGAVLMFLTTDIGKIFGHNGHRWMLTIGVSLWATVLMALTILNASRSSPGRPINRSAAKTELPNGN